MRAKGLVIGALLAAALVLAGCGTAAKGGSSAVTVNGHALAVYSSQPPGAPTPAQSDIQDAERLALSQAGGKAGSFSVTLITVRERELSANARTAIENPNTIAYLGELVPGTSQVSLEITNQEGVLEVSPADTAAYLTQPVPSVSSTPNNFDPGHSTYKQTFARVVPNSTEEAKALVKGMQSEHVSSLAVASDSTDYGRTVALEVSHAAKAAGMTVTGSAAQAQAYLYGADTSSPAARATAVQAYDRAAAANPSLKLFAPSGLYDPAFVAGLSPAAQGRLFVSSPGFLPHDLPPAGRTFVRQFTQQFGHTPAPLAIFGYEAMDALLATLDQAKTAANQRATVVTDFRSLKRTDSVLGPYSITGGDPSIAPFVLARVRAGQLVPFQSVSPTG